MTIENTNPPRRYLTIVFALKHDGVARIITGWDMDRAEIRYWQKHRG